VSAYRKAITALFDALQLPKAVVIGSSLGGTLGIMLALDRPDRVDRLIVLDAAGLVPTIPKKTVRLYLPFVLPAYLRAPRPKNARRLLQTAVFHDPRLVEEAWVETIVEQWRPRARRSAFIATGNALRGPDASVAGDLERVRAPTLVLWGRQDPQFDWQIGEAAARRIPGARFVAIENCGHFPMVEKPVETATAISAFLAS
jgi:pimeloyl-ACP methyl ester carboxylesterase